MPGDAILVIKQTCHLSSYCLCQESRINRVVIALFAMWLATAAQAAEYMQKTPFQLSRRFRLG
jgi:hypothetical protein